MTQSQHTSHVGITTVYILFPACFAIWRKACLSPCNSKHYR